MVFLCLPNFLASQYDDILFEESEHKYWEFEGRFSENKNEKCQTLFLEKINFFFYTIEEKTFCSEVSSINCDPSNLQRYYSRINLKDIHFLSNVWRLGTQKNWQIKYLKKNGKEKLKSNKKYSSLTKMLIHNSISHTNPIADPKSLDAQCTKFKDKTKLESADQIYWIAI